MESEFMVEGFDGEIECLSSLVALFVVFRVSEDLEYRLTEPEATEGR